MVLPETTVRPRRAATAGTPRARRGAARAHGSAAQVLPGLPAPVPQAALDLLVRSDAELAAAQLCSDSSERFRHSHLAALRAAAAVVAAAPPPARRGAPRTVWSMLQQSAPDLAGWATYFADGAPLRAAVEAGRATVTAERAEAIARAAEDFQDAVRHHLEGGGREQVRAG